MNTNALKSKPARRLAWGAAALLAVLGLSSCSVIFGRMSQGMHRPFQMDSPMVNVMELDKEGRETNKKVADLGIVEFDDQGQLWRDNYKDRNAKVPGRSQMATVLAALRERAKEGPVQLILFAHGWNNNSRSLDEGNLKSFQSALRSVAGKHTKPFGVFLSWRGKAMSMKTWVDIYNREASAVKIGQVESTAAIQALCTTARQAKGSRVLAVGHSLGAVILLRAVAAPMASQIAQASIDAEAAKTMSPMVDTVVLVNAADTAVVASKMVRVMQDYAVQFKRGGRDAPLLVSFTSKGDWATGGLYSTATFISRYLLGSFMTSASGATSTRTQEHATITSVGWHKAIHSHDLIEDPTVKPLPLPEALTEAQKTGRPQTESERAKYLLSQNFQPAQPGQKNLVVWLDPTLERGKVSTGPLKAFNLLHDKQAHLNDTPFWIFRVDKFVVYNHTDVWNSNFVGLVTALHNASREPKPASQKSTALPTPGAGKVQELPPIKQGTMSAKPRY